MDLDRILVSNAMMPTTPNTPLDARIVVEDRESIAKIQVPYVGMVFYVKDEGLLYVVKSLKSKELFGVSIPNALVDEYEPLISSEMNHAIEVILDNEKTMEQNKAIWENVQQLSGANNIVESLQNILTGKNQDEILDIAEDDIGKILSVGQNENGEIIYSGSARGYEMSGISNFKDICEETNYIEWTAGHQNAFGLCITSEKVKYFLEKTDEALANMSSEPVYYVDYIYSGADVHPVDILEISNLKPLWGKDMDEPYIALKGLKVKKEMVTVYSKKDLTLKITLPNRVSLIMFRAPQDLCDMLQNQNPGYYIMNIVSRCAANEYYGNVTPQLKIKDWEITGQSAWDF